MPNSGLMACRSMFAQDRQLHDMAGMVRHLDTSLTQMSLAGGSEVQDMAVEYGVVGSMSCEC